MKTSDFDYILPEDLIAQRPLEQRDSSRLLCLSKTSGTITHHIFQDIYSLLKAGDRLVLNNTRVLPARLFCRKETGARIELLCAARMNDRTWKVLIKPVRRIKTGTILLVESDPLIQLIIEKNCGDGYWLVTIKSGPLSSLHELLDLYGKMPLPPYIRRHTEENDRHTYQTVYAQKDGAIAAPTAGLHFTDTLINRLHEKGIEFSYITLHVGLGTFKPIKVDDPRQHPMHREAYWLGKKAAQEISETKKQGRRVIAVGTTSVRVLEHCVANDGSISEDQGMTDLMIFPGYRFKIIDGLITNFHLPRSTLLMLVSALAGRENIRTAYESAVNLKYRFYSYGDAMFIH